MSYTPRLKEKYQSEIVSQLTDKFGYKTLMRVPKLQKIVLSQGMGDAVADKKLIDSAVADLSRIAGQKAVTTISKKDISNFKLRKGMPIGTKVTLRGDRMYDFLDRLLSVSLPRTRDFRGINPKGFDGRGYFIKKLIFFSLGLNLGLFELSLGRFDVTRISVKQWQFKANFDSRIGPDIVTTPVLGLVTKRYVWNGLGFLQLNLGIAHLNLIARPQIVCTIVLALSKEGGQGRSILGP